MSNTKKQYLIARGYKLVENQDVYEKRSFFGLFIKRLAVPTKVTDKAVVYIPNGIDEIEIVAEHDNYKITSKIVESLFDEIDLQSTN